MNVKEVYDYQFLSPFKKCIPTSFQFQKISLFEIEYTFFNQRNKKYEFSPPFKKQFIQIKISMPKSSVIEIEYTSFNQRNEINVEEDYQFLPFFKSVSGQKLSCRKISVFQIEYTFCQSMEQKLLEGDYQFLSPFKKWIPTSTSMPKTFIV